MSSAVTSKAVILEDFDKICRTCLGEEKLCPIKGTLVYDINLDDLLKYSVMIEASENDLLPQYICENCLTAMYKVYEFKKLCQDNENMLKLVVQNSSHKHEVKEELSDITLMEGNEEYKCSSPEDNYDQAQNDLIKDRLKCRDCGYTSSSKEEMRIHRKTAQHGYLRKHKCQICNKEFLRAKMREHMRSHTKERPYKCNMCPQSFTVSCNLRRHEKTHTGERPHVCNVCGKRFTRSSYLHNHRRTHQADENRAPEGSGDIKFICNICGRGFKLCTSFKTHLKKHTNGDQLDSKVDKSDEEQEARDYLCDICARAFKSTILLKRHRLIHGEKTFLCSICGKSYLRNAELSLHLRRHTGEKPYTCVVCKKAFAMSTSLNVHMLIHKGLKPHKCTYNNCSKSFTQRAHLIRHWRTHSGERPYTCTYCDKSFALNENLTVHIRTHTGETPYVCPVCGKGFYDSSSMKKHRQKHIKAKLEVEPHPQSMKDDVSVKS